MKSVWSHISHAVQRVALMASVALTVASCEPVFEEPGDCCEPRKVFDIQIHFDVSFGDAIHNAVRSADDNVALRCTVYAYRNETTATGTSRTTSRVGEAPDEIFTLTLPNYTDDSTLDLSLPSGNWSLLLWADYYRIDEGFEYYDVSDFSEIRLNEEFGHRGCDDYRDAFRGYAEVEIDAYNEAPVEDITINMERPMAKFTVITTDLDEFTAKVVNSTQKVVSQSPESAAQSSDNASESSESSSESSESSEQASEKSSVNLDEYTIRFYYSGFMPNAFNMFNDKPSDAATGVWFDGKVKKLSGSEAEIGFDYVFTNGTESTLTIAVAVYDINGQCISVTSPYEVKVKRNQETKVRGKFMTAFGSGGTRIDPSFQGEYNLYYP